jgi:hypothetical protein
MPTTFSNKVAILADLFVNYANDSEFEDFIEYNDLGLPLAHLANQGLCSITNEGEGYIEETWLLFLDAFGVEDLGFQTLDEFLSRIIPTE